MLTPRKRITKKDLKEDKLVTFYVNAQEWIEGHARLLTTVAVAVLVIIVGTYFYTTNRSKSKVTASAELAKAVRLYEQNDFNNAVSLLGQIVESHGSTGSGKLARYYLANALYETNEYSLAQEHFRRFARDFGGDDHLIASAHAGVAACLEQQDQFAEAAKKYESTTKQFPKAPLASRYLLRAARCYSLAGNSEKAEQLYDKLITDYPDSAERNEALLLSALE